MPHVLIIGGSRGIGRATAEHYLKQGWRVGISYNATEPEFLKQYPEDQYFASSCDVQSEEEIQKFWGEYKERFEKKLDVFIYSSGITVDSLCIQSKTEEFDKVLNINLRGAYIFLREVGHFLYFRKKGKMFFLSSVSARRGARGQLSYAVSKAGMEAMVRVGAQEFSRAGVMINAIAPGVVETDMSQKVLDYVKENKKEKGLFDRIAMNRVAQPEEIAKFLYALSHEEITYLTGHTLTIDGGYML
jgi:3-oxoacyl-[acyl-carrier protein] reductase